MFRGRERGEGRKKRGESVRENERIDREKERRETGEGRRGGGRDTNTESKDVLAFAYFQVSIHWSYFTSEYYVYNNKEDGGTEILKSTFVFVGACLLIASKSHDIVS